MGFNSFVLPQPSPAIPATIAGGYPLTITGVTVPTLALAGSAISPAPGQVYTFDAWGTVTTTVDTQTLNFGIYLGGIGGTLINATGVLNPDSSATITNATIRIKGTLVFLSATQVSCEMQIDLNYFPVTVSQIVATVTAAANQQLAIGITPSAAAVSVTINGGYWQRVA